MAKYAITGASGQLGRLILDAVVEKKLNAADFVALARDPATLADYQAKGFVVRALDYTKPETFDAAFAGVEKIVFISSNAIGQRLVSHKAVIDFVAAQAKPAQLIYTSLLHADTSKLILADEHKQTEAYIQEKIPSYVILRNGWYIENYTSSLAAALAGGQQAGAAKQGKIAGASRKDYAEAALAVLVQDHQNKIFELAGDVPFSMDEFAAAVAEVSGKPFKYVDLPEAEYAAVLQTFGFPEGFAQIVAQCDAAVAVGELNDEQKQLSQLIGRPTTPLKQVIQQALPSQ